jgi:hypothetical protein
MMTELVLSELVLTEASVAPGASIKAESAPAWLVSYVT